jgi:hypothetical protein
VASERWPAPLENECAAIDYLQRHLGLGGIQLRFLLKINVAVDLHRVGRAATVHRQLGRVAKEVDRPLTMGVVMRRRSPVSNRTKKPRPAGFVRREISPASSCASIMSSVAAMIALSVC